MEGRREGRREKEGGQTMSCSYSWPCSAESVLTVKMSQIQTVADSPRLGGSTLIIFLILKTILPQCSNYSGNHMYVQSFPEIFANVKL